MGFESDEEAAMMQEALDAGMDPYEASAQLLGVTVNGPVGETPPTTSVPTPTPTPAPAAQPAAAPKPEKTENVTASAPKETEKTYSHDYDEISDEAREAFEYFTHDNTPDSVYLNIKTSSEKNVLTGKELNATAANNEDGKVSFVDENGNMSYEWLFSNWNSDDNYELDLKATFEKYDTEDFEAAYLLKFFGNKTLENDVIFRIQTGMPDADLHVYDMVDGDYVDIYTGTTDGNGVLELHPKELKEYVISPDGPIIAEDEPEPEETVEEEMVEEPVVAEKPEEPAPVVAPEPKPEKKPFPILPVAVIAIILVTIVAAVISVRKRH